MSVQRRHDLIKPMTALLLILAVCLGCLPAPAEAPQSRPVQESVVSSGIIW